MDEADKLKRWRETTETLLLAVDYKHCQPYSIISVPDELRKWNENEYEPKVVSIGPRYKGRRELQLMEETKWRCMRSLLMRTQEDAKDSLETCMRAMLELDTVVRVSYGDEIKLDRYELATIMVYDGCFLLELLISGSTEWNSTLKSVMFPPGPGSQVGKIEAVSSDLMLLENQIPLFILQHLFQLLFPHADPNTIGIATYFRIIENLARSLLDYCPYSSSNSTTNPIYAAQFLELAHSSIPRESNRQSLQDLSFLLDIDNRKQVKLNRCVTRLQIVGVTIKSEKNCVIAIFSSSKFDIKFNNSDGVEVATNF